MRPALDGMLGAVLKAYRSVLDGAGLPWLRSVWPSLVRLMDHVSSTWDSADDGAGDGVLRGDQPVTYDISLHGPNMFVGGLWLAALRAMGRMASLVDEPSSYEDRFLLASKAYDTLLWNGEYYEQVLDEEDDVTFQWLTGCLSLTCIIKNNIKCLGCLSIFLIAFNIA